MPHWCKNTLIKAYRLKFICGSHGYQELLRNNSPLPSLQTLSCYLENFKFVPGISNEMFVFLKFKVAQFENNIDKDCIVIVDEMSITPGKFYCMATNIIFDESTISSATESNTILKMLYYYFNFIFIFICKICV